MGGSCKGRCSEYKAAHKAGAKRYLNGEKRCQICNIWVFWDGVYCPCCAHKLRTTPRGFKKARNEFQLESGGGKRY